MKQSFIETLNKNIDLLQDRMTMLTDTNDLIRLSEEIRSIMHLLEHNREGHKPDMLYCRKYGNFCRDMENVKIKIDCDKTNCEKCQWSVHTY